MHRHPPRLSRTNAAAPTPRTRSGGLSRGAVPRTLAAVEWARATPRREPPRYPRRSPILAIASKVSKQCPWGQRRGIALRWHARASGGHKDPSSDEVSHLFGKLNPCAPSVPSGGYGKCATETFLDDHRLWSARREPPGHLLKQLVVDIQGGPHTDMLIDAPRFRNSTPQANRLHRTT